jgi:Zn-dependent protease/predicted transcriptional regulator
LSHAAVAKARGIPVHSITLFALGGVANMERESEDARSEFWMAIAGPITSVLIGLSFLAIARVAGWHPASGTPPSPVWAGFVWLGYINIALAIFNMIPGYPLDGGRVLGSIIWAINGNRVRATKIAAGVGQTIAIAFIVFGFFRFFSAGAFAGLWLAFIGWFLAEAAGATRAGIAVSATLQNVRAVDVMSKDFPAVQENVNLRTFAEDYLLRTGRRSFVVVGNGGQRGLVTVNELKRIKPERWPFTTVGEIAEPLERVSSVSPEAPLVRALELMGQDGADQVPVISGGQLVGVVRRADVAQFMQTRQELKAA